jgi:hypothetical protein
MVLVSTIEWGATPGLDKEEKSVIIINAVNEGLEKLMEVIETNRR